MPRSTRVLRLNFFFGQAVYDSRYNIVSLMYLFRSGSGPEASGGWRGGGGALPDRGGGGAGGIRLHRGADAQELRGHAQEDGQVLREQHAQGQEQQAFFSLPKSQGQRKGHEGHQRREGGGRAAVEEKNEFCAAPCFPGKERKNNNIYLLERNVKFDTS